jgi:ribosomal protein S18 acetylase RimI-like enzyme
MSPPASLRYEVDASNERDIGIHLRACAGDFDPPLHERVDIDAYSRKLAERSLRIEAWQGDVLVGLVAAYVAGDGDSCYVTNVSVVPGLQRRGVARELMSRLGTHPACARATTTLLEVSKNSVGAVRLYVALGFEVTGESGDRILMRHERISGHAPVSRRTGA